MSSVEVDVLAVDELQDGQMKEVSLGEGRGKALISKVNGDFFATSHLCPHYKAPMAKGVLAKDGRIMCPWHGACFRVQTGDIEDGPSLDSLQSFEVKVKGGRVYVLAREEDVKAGKKVPVCTKHKVAEEKHVVILGGGAGGAIAAEALRQEGFNGRITLVSREPYLPIDRPKLSKALKIDPSKIQLRDAQFYADHKVDVLLDTVATAVDTEAKTVTLNKGSPLSYSYLILATGGDPRTLPIPGGNLSNIFVMRGANDTNAIEKAVSEFEKPNVVVVGSSFIGMEAAAILAKTANVTVCGLEKVPFERVLGSQVGEALGKLNTSNGINLMMQTLADRFEASAKNKDKVGAVVFKSGEKVAADVVIIGAGVIPKTDYLKGSGITLDRDQGITVDATMQVPNVEGVFAIGDIARYPYHLTGESVRIEHWNVAQNQGRLAAKNIVALLSGKEPSKFVQVPYFWTVQYGKSVRYAGHAESFDEVLIQGSLDVDNLSFAAYYARQGTILAVASVAKDPVVSHASELFRAGKFPSIQELRAGKDLLKYSLDGDSSYVHVPKKKTLKDESTVRPINNTSMLLFTIPIVVAVVAIALIYYKK
ncbi:hypothetical protein HDV05_004915 [Chytridiales sp. JEL 0842]|nr:hypothetical protein HDV05_004915 [Chytridiales sp. JEL 0842]